MKLEVGALYKHFKGHKYKVLMVAKDASTLEDMVIYQNTDDESLIWVRPLYEFTSKVDKIKYQNVKQEYRFEKIND